MALADIVTALNGEKSGAGYKCRCPAHPDKQNSLQVTEENGKLLLHCFAGCSYQTIRQKLIDQGLLTPAQRRLSSVTQTIEATYRYTDASGRLLFEKLRRPNKKFVQRKPEGDGWTYKNVTQGITVPLYRLPELLSSTALVCVTEGEKDADNLVKLGLTATCNFDGAGKWRDHYSDWLAGRDVVLFEDNDESGRKHVQLLSRKLQGKAAKIRVVTFRDCPEKSDVSDWLAAGNGRWELEQLIDQATGVTVEPEAPTDRKSAIYEDYVTLFNTILHNPRRDIFSNKLLTLDRGLWQSAHNYLGILRSRAAQIQEQGGLKFNRQLMADYLEDFESHKDPELLMDIPEWDGHDHIADFARCVSLNPAALSDSCDFEHWLKWWLSTALQKVEQPRIQNRILILHGAQGIGKDTWIDSLLCGAGQFLHTLSAVSGDKDTFLALHDGMFLKISEFEKTARTEVSLLKDLITTPTTNLRAPYARDTQRRDVRCSFISSSNERNLLRDPTGARRYLIFELSELRWNYPVMDPAIGGQVLAQARALAGHQVPALTQQRMAAYLEEKTPEDPAVTCIRIWGDVIDRWIQNNPVLSAGVTARGWIYNEECDDLILETAKLAGVKPRTVRDWLNTNEMGMRNGRHRGYLCRPLEGPTSV